MGNKASKIPTLQILKVTENSISHANNILPFMHTIIKINDKPIEESMDALEIMNLWKAADLDLLIHDLRTSKKYNIVIPKNESDLRLGMGVKFHEDIIDLFTIKILKIMEGSYAQKCGLLKFDYILGVENVSCETENELLRYLENKKRQGMTLLVFNEKLNMIRRVFFKVDKGLSLFGCEIGLGILCAIPSDERKINVEFDQRIIDEKIKELADEFVNEDVNDEQISKEHNDMINEPNETANNNEESNNIDKEDKEKEAAKKDQNLNDISNEVAEQKDSTNEGEERTNTVKNTDKGVKEKTGPENDLKELNDSVRGNSNQEDTEKDKVLYDEKPSNTNEDNRMEDRKQDNTENKKDKQFGETYEEAQNEDKNTVKEALNDTEKDIKTQKNIQKDTNIVGEKQDEKKMGEQFSVTQEDNNVQKEKEVGKDTNSPVEEPKEGLFENDPKDDEVQLKDVVESKENDVEEQRDIKVINATNVEVVESKENDVEEQKERLVGETQKEIEAKDAADLEDKEQKEKLAEEGRKEIEDDIKDVEKATNSDDEGLKEDETINKIKETLEDMKAEIANKIKESVEDKEITEGSKDIRDEDINSEEEQNTEGKNVTNPEIFNTEDIRDEDIKREEEQNTEGKNVTNPEIFNTEDIRDEDINSEEEQNTEGKDVTNLMDNTVKDNIETIKGEDNANNINKDMNNVNNNMDGEVNVNEEQNSGKEDIPENNYEVKDKQKDEEEKYKNSNEKTVNNSEDHKSQDNSLILTESSNKWKEDDNRNSQSEINKEIDNLPVDESDMQKDNKSETLQDMMNKDQQVNNNGNTMNNREDEEETKGQAGESEDYNRQDDGNSDTLESKLVNNSQLEDSFESIIEEQSYKKDDSKEQNMTHVKNDNKLTADNNLDDHRALQSELNKTITSSMSNYTPNKHKSSISYETQEGPINKEEPNWSDKNKHTNEVKEKMIGTEEKINDKNGDEMDKEKDMNKNNIEEYDKVKKMKANREDSFSKKNDIMSDKKEDTDNVTSETNKSNNVGESEERIIETLASVTKETNTNQLYDTKEVTNTNQLYDTKEETNIKEDYIQYNPAINSDIYNQVKEDDQIEETKKEDSNQVNEGNLDYRKHEDNFSFNNEISFLSSNEEEDIFSNLPTIDKSEKETNNKHVSTIRDIETDPSDNKDIKEETSTEGDIRETPSVDRDNNSLYEDIKPTVIESSVEFSNHKAVRKPIARQEEINSTVVENTSTILKEKAYADQDIEEYSDIQKSQVNLVNELSSASEVTDKQVDELLKDSDKSFTVYENTRISNLQDYEVLSVKSETNRNPTPEDLKVINEIKDNLLINENTEMTEYKTASSTIKAEHFQDFATEVENNLKKGFVSEMVDKISKEYFKSSEEPVEDNTLMGIERRSNKLAFQREMLLAELSGNNQVNIENSISKSDSVNLEIDDSKILEMLKNDEKSVDIQINDKGVLEELRSQEKSNEK